jgi:hypothetical protein
MDSASSFTNRGSPPSPVYTAPNTDQAAAAPAKKSYSPFGSKSVVKSGSPTGSSYLNGVTNGSPMDSTSSFTNGASPPSPVDTAPNTDQAAAAPAKKSYSPVGSKPVVRTASFTNGASRSGSVYTPME